MASTFTVQLGRNGRYAIIVDSQGNQYPCTDPEEAFDVLMELAGRNEPSAPYVEPEYVEAEYVDDQYDDQEYADYEVVGEDGAELAHYDHGPQEQTIVDHGSGEDRLDFGDPVSNAAAEMAVNGGVTLFRTLQGLSYRGGSETRRAELHRRREERKKQSKAERLNKLRRR